MIQNMNVNQVIHQLYSTSEPWITYTQSINIFNPYLDSAYNNHITFTNEFIQITIPEQIDVIHNIRTSWETELFVYKKQTIAPLKDNFLFNSREPICIRFKHPGLDPNKNYMFEFSATIFKKSVQTKLRSLL